MKLFIAGPCGVGKSTVAKSLANRANIAYLDFDDIGLLDMQKRKGHVSPFSASRLDLMLSMPIILTTTCTDYILDMGGDTVFRKTADNNERLEQVLWVKKTYTPHIIVLTAIKDILLTRYTSAKVRIINEFDDIWENWLCIAEPYWQKCWDIVIDTSFLTVDETIGQIESHLNRST